MARVVAQSTLLAAPTQVHGIEEPKRSVIMASSLQTPVLRISGGSIPLDKMVGFGQHFRPSQLGRGSRCVAKAKFEGFTKTALEAIMLAREESRRIGFDYICSEELLAGLVGVGTGVAAQVLKSMGITLEGVRKQLEEDTPIVCGFAAVGFSLTCVAGHLVRSFEEARKLGHNYIGPEHILLGLLRDFETCYFISQLGVDSNNIVTEVIRMVGEGNKGSVVTERLTCNTRMPTLGAYGTSLTKLAGEVTNLVDNFKKDPALKRRFLPIKVPNPSENEISIILKSLKEHCEVLHGLCYNESALQAAEVLSYKYISDLYLPDKAIDLMKEAGARVSSRHAQLLEVVREFRTELRQIKESFRDSRKDKESYYRELELRFQIFIFHEMSNEEKEVTSRDIEDIISSWTGIPVQKVEKFEDIRSKVEETLHERVIGQDEAVKAIMIALNRVPIGINLCCQPNSFIFSGPSGVGKSELAKALAAKIFGSEEDVIQFDMSEFMESDTISKLFGSPPWYTKGQLTESVQRRPYSVVLFKEIEKAHPDVLNMILHILEFGRLTADNGRVVDFKNALMIMTSNVGSSVIYKGERFHLDENYNYNIRKRLVIEQLKQYFRQELLNIVDEVIVFRQLTQLEVKKIADILLKEVHDRLKEKGIRVYVTQRFRDRVVEEGYDPSYGARPLRGAIARLIEDRMAEKMLARKVEKGDLVLVDVDSNGNVVDLNGRYGAL
ncbi:hypothetical protein V6N13_128240 [Hibiscus sabdariffa]|uniref:Clp R domain-containing protein n=1 Tax=Hibiscus sabdariffa TaxID=183260 RepID=A0ABR2P1F8_9ROSI